MLFCYVVKRHRVSNCSKAGLEIRLFPLHPCLDFIRNNLFTFQRDVDPFQNLVYRRNRYSLALISIPDDLASYLGSWFGWLERIVIDTRKPSKNTRQIHQ